MKPAARNAANFAEQKLNNIDRGLYAAIGLAFLVAGLSFASLKFLGPSGPAVLAGGLLAATLAAALALRSPVLVFILWLVFLSGLHTVGLLRMPGLPDMSIARMVMVLIMVMMVLAMLFGKNPFKAPVLPDILVILHTSYILFNAMFIADGSHFNLWYVSCLSPMLAYFFGKQFVESDRHIQQIIYSFVFMTAYFWLVSIAEHFRIMFLIWPKTIIDAMGQHWVGRSRGPFLQPAVFGQILGMYLLVHFYLLTRKISQVRRLLIWGNLALGSVGLLFTYTRGGWLATLAGIGVLGVLRPGYRKMILIMCFVGIVFGTAGLLQRANGDLLQDRVGNTGTIENRAGVMYAAFKAIQNNPFFGVGFFEFKNVAYLYSQGAYVPGIGYVKKKMGDHGSIHDMYVGRTAEEGLIGMALWFAFLVAVSRNYIRRWKENPQGEWFNRDLITLFAALSAVYLVGGMAINFRFFALINILPYFFAGVVAGFPVKTADSITAETGSTVL